MDTRRSNEIRAEFRIGDDRKGILINYDAINIPMEKRSLIEEAANAFLDQAAEILNRED